MTPGLAESVDLSVLSGVAPELAAAFVSLASDIALVIGDDGVIRNVVVGQADAGAAVNGWVGKAWAETVTGDTRRKIEQLLLEVNGGGVSRRREVNHPSPSGRDIPIAYTALRLGDHGPVLAVGRDLRAVAAIQQRFIDAQQEMERDYWKLRQAQSRSRLLQQVTGDAVMVVDARTLGVVEFNPGAAHLFDLPSSRLPQPLEDLLAMARSSGRGGEIRTHLPAPLGAADTAPRHIELSATPFRAAAAARDDTMRLLVRARPVGAAPDADAVERSATGVVVTDSSGRVVMANPAFAALCRHPGGAATGGHLLTDALGDPQRGIAALLYEVRRRGLVQQTVTVGGAPSGMVDVLISAALLADGDQECIGITLHRADRPPAVAAGRPDLTAAIEHLIGRMGQCPLPELMREAVEAAERHLIQAALQRTPADPVAAAALLGVHPADLDERLRRLGLPAAGSAAAPSPAD